MAEKIIEFVYERPLAAIGIAAIVDFIIVLLFVWLVIL
jgi:ElaB/YqjD/DUF883 family membrane-anchored ribosome-binding protein